jgi:hypothetical protein
MKTIIITTTRQRRNHISKTQEYNHDKITCHVCTTMSNELTINTLESLEDMYVRACINNISSERTLFSVCDKKRRVVMFD